MAKKSCGNRCFAGAFEKAKLVDWYREDRKEYFAVMAREGFTEEAKRLAERKEMLLFSPYDVDLINE